MFLGTKGRVYIVQIGTSFCGYLTVMSAIASDADYCYIYEKQFNENDIKRDANTIKNKMIADNRNRLIVMSVLRMPFFCNDSIFLFIGMRSQIII